MSITLILVILTCLISYQAFQNPGIIERCKHFPYAEARNKEYYRFLTSGFLHGGWFHLLVNMFVLYSFGIAVEMKYGLHFGQLKGNILFLVVYLLTMILADIPSFFRHRNNYTYSSIGASGAVNGILFISVLFDPWSIILVYGLIPIPGILAALAYLAYSSWASKNRRDMIDHQAHFYGALFGIGLTVMLKPELFMVFIEKLMNVPW